MKEIYVKFELKINKIAFTKLTGNLQIRHCWCRTFPTHKKRKQKKFLWVLDWKAVGKEIELINQNAK